MVFSGQFLRAVVIAAATAVLASAAGAADFKPIGSEADFKKLVANKKLLLGENHVVIKKNGKLTGNFDGKDLKGVWQWRDGFWCRTLTAPVENTDCQLFEISGNQLRGTRQRGKGKSFVYTIQ